MSDALSELDEMLSDPGYWDAEHFLMFDEVVPRLTDQDVVEPFRMRQHRSAEWWENLHHAVPSMTQTRLSRIVFDGLDSDDPAEVAEGFALFLATTWQGAWINDPELDTVERLWRARPEWRAAIQQTLWKAGKSGQLRRRLGFQTWSDSKAFPAKSAPDR